jgi:ubiquinone/menaquinone biosynthesis C-methylase UbiE
MLERAQARALGVELVHASSLALPWREPQFDAIIALHHLGHLPEAEHAAAWREWTRVLEPGGIVVLVEHRWHRLHTEGMVLRRTEIIRPGMMRLTVWERPPACGPEEAN